MGTEWCVENSSRWCSAHSLHAHLRLVPHLSLVRSPQFFVGSTPCFCPSSYGFPPQMTTQLSTYPRRSRRQARIEGQEGTRRTLRWPWRKLERARKRWSWDLKTVFWRHCRSSGSQDTECITRATQCGRSFRPFPLGGLWTCACGCGRSISNVKRKRKSRLGVLDTGHPLSFPPTSRVLSSLSVFLSLSCGIFYFFKTFLDLFSPSDDPSRCV